MSEKGILLFQDIVMGMEIFIDAVCLAVFFKPFMIQGRVHIGKKLCIVFLIYAAVFLLGMGIPIYGWMRMLIVIVLLLAASEFLNIDKCFSIWLGILFFSMKYMSNLIMESFHYVVSAKLVSGVTEETVIYRNVAIGYSITLVLQRMLFSLMLYFVERKLIKGMHKLHTRELCYLCFIPIGGILFANIIFRLFLVAKEHVIFQLYEQYPTFLGLVPMIAILFYMGTVIEIASYQEMVSLQEEKRKFFVEEQQVHAMKERMEEVEQFYHGIRQMKHDMRNHLTNIKGLLERGSYEDMEQYIVKMDESMNVFALTIQTGNAVTDVIVNDKKKAADRQGIKFYSAFSYPVSDGYNAYDIGIILHNLLTNALEACGKMEAGEKYIFLSGRQKKKFFLIEVRNSFQGEIAFDENTKLPVSTKKDAEDQLFSLHGIGLSNVKREVGKYMGDISIKAEENEFSVTVLLQERSHHE